MGQRFVVDRRIEQFLRDAASGRTAGLHALHLLAFGAAFTYVVNEGLERSAEGHFDEAGVVDFADE